MSRASFARWLDKLSLESEPRQWLTRFVQSYNYRCDQGHELAREVADFLLWQQREALSWLPITLPQLVQYSRFRQELARGQVREGLVRRLRSLGQWCRFLHRANLMLQLPELPRLRASASLRKTRTPLSYEQIQRLLSLPDCRLPKGLRDRAILEVAYSTGMRRSELAALEIEDLQLEEAMVFVRAPKNRCQRFAPLTSSARHWLLRYLNEARPALARSGSESTCLWLNFSGTRFAPHGFDRLSFRYRWSEVLGRPCSLHYLRHSLASHLLANGADLVTVQVWLGHRAIESTQVYTHLSRLELARNLRACHPFEQAR